MSSATIRDVAREAGVGVGTVSRVLNNHPSVSTATRQRVLQAIEALDFRPNPNAQRLSRGRTNTIGIIAPLFITDSYIERLQGIESILAESEFDLTLFNVETVERRRRVFARVPRRDRVDGLVIISIRPTQEEVARFEQARLPVVLIDNHHPELSYVAIDDVEGGRAATQHLIELGHRRIAFVGEDMDNPMQFTPTRDRYHGYRLALRESGLPYRSDYFIEGEPGRLPAQVMMRRLLALEQPPTAVFAMTDKQAIGIIEAASRAGLEVPRDISVIGYDDIDAAEYMGLTTIHQPLRESGRQGIQLLLEQIAQPAMEPQQILLPTHLVQRRTTARAVA